MHNPSCVLLVYRDQLDAQTPDQVMVYVKVYGSILISFIFPVKFININCSHVGLMAAIRGRVT